MSIAVAPDVVAIRCCACKAVTVLPCRTVLCFLGPRLGTSNDLPTQITVSLLRQRCSSELTGRLSRKLPGKDKEKTEKTQGRRATGDRGRKRRKGSGFGYRCSTSRWGPLRIVDRICGNRRNLRIKSSRRWSVRSSQLEISVHPRSSAVLLSPW